MTVLNMRNCRIAMYEEGGTGEARVDRWRGNLPGGSINGSSGQVPLAARDQRSATHLSVWPGVRQ